MNIQNYYWNSIVKKNKIKQKLVEPYPRAVAIEKINEYDNTDFAQYSDLESFRKKVLFIYMKTQNNNK